MGSLTRCRIFIYGCNVEPPLNISWSHAIRLSGRQTVHSLILVSVIARHAV